jgi:hypothetical protein
MLVANEKPYYFDNYSFQECSLTDYKYNAVCQKYNKAHLTAGARFINEANGCIRIAIDCIKHKKSFVVYLKIDTK